MDTFGKVTFDECNRPCIYMHVCSLNKQHSIIEKFLIDTGGNKLYIQTYVLGFCEAICMGNRNQKIGGDTNVRTYKNIGIKIPFVKDNIPISFNNEKNGIVFEPKRVAELERYSIIGSGIFEQLGLELNIKYRRKLVSLYPDI